MKTASMRLSFYNKLAIRISMHFIANQKMIVNNKMLQGHIVLMF